MCCVWLILTRYVRGRVLEARERVETPWRAALSVSGQSIWWLDPSDWSVRINRDAPHFLPGWAEQSIGWEEWLSHAEPADQPRLKHALRQCLEGVHDDFRCEYRIRQADGRLRWCLSRGQPVMLHEQQMLCGSLVDITAEKQVADERDRLNSVLMDEKERLRAILTSIEDAVMAVDSEGRVTFFNPAAEHLAGRLEGDALGCRATSLFSLSNGNISSDEAALTRCLRTGQSLTLASPVELVNYRGRRFQVRGTLLITRTPEGETTGAVLTLHDVTYSISLLQQLDHSARFDTLTSLFNRRSLEARLQCILSHAEASSVLCALIVLDIDRFKLINDLAGHHAGDRLLSKVGQLLRDQVNEGSMVARLGSDEFGIIAPFEGLEQARAFADVLLRKIRAHPFEWGGRMHDITASMGLVLFGRMPLDTGELLGKADIACLSARHAGGDRVCIFDLNQSEVQQYATRMNVAVDMREALRQERFMLYGQQIVSLEGGRVRNVEILLRMRDQDDNPVSPGVFIPVAEQYGLMPAVDRWVIHQTLIRYGPRLAETHGRISINVSGASLGDESFTSFLCHTLSISCLPPSRLVFEITETALIGHLDSARQLVDALRNKGCLVALDDFGSGLSSFSYLQQFDVDIIKIDGAFIKHLDSQPLDYAIVESILGVATHIKAITVAEYVENQTVYDLLQGMGVHYAQGYHMHVPESLDTLLSVSGCRALT